MNWTKLIYVFIIALLYVPMVFLGSNVFFPKYTGSHSYYQGFDDCYRKHPYPAQPEKLTTPEQQALDEKQQQCEKENREKQNIWEEEKRQYDSKKYIFIAAFNLVILLLALFLPKLQDSVVMGLFVGSVIATFASTIRYYDTNSRVGFSILVVTFFAVLYFINRKKESFVNWKQR